MSFARVFYDFIVSVLPPSVQNLELHPRCKADDVDENGRSLAQITRLSLFRLCYDDIACARLSPAQRHALYSCMASDSLATRCLAYRALRHAVHFSSFDDAVTRYVQVARGLVSGLTPEQYHAGELLVSLSSQDRHQRRLLQLFDTLGEVLAKCHSATDLFGTQAFCWVLASEANERVVEHIIRAKATLINPLTRIATSALILSPGERSYQMDRGGMTPSTTSDRESRRFGVLDVRGLFSSEASRASEASVSGAPVLTASRAPSLDDSSLTQRAAVWFASEHFAEAFARMGLMQMSRQRGLWRPDVERRELYVRAAVAMIQSWQIAPAVFAYSVMYSAIFGPRRPYGPAFVNYAIGRWAATVGLTVAMLRWTEWRSQKERWRHRYTTFMVDLWRQGPRTSPPPFTILDDDTVADRLMRRKMSAAAAVVLGPWVLRPFLRGLVVPVYATAFGAWWYDSGEHVTRWRPESGYAILAADFAERCRFAARFGIVRKYAALQEDECGVPRQAIALIK
eukprot:TRINITY_DN1960_c0_g1_i1.p1 TRINITY_DN1960_c0_g1~~TRINITY_DN1960_c0_g1_i1.p1  ORF type:complete len:512 (-),score=93.67 TRINITY_DN1960_c0_g1_i1:1004-2539(-)